MNYNVIKANVRKMPTMEKALAYLRSNSFVFLSFETINDWYNAAIKVMAIPEDFKDYSFMLHETKPGSLNQRGEFYYDLIFCIKLNGVKTNKIVVLEKDAKGEPEIIPVNWEKQKAINFRKLIITLKFPKDMPYEDRKFWRRENDKLKKDPNYQPKEVYWKWTDRVERLSPKK